MVFIILICLGFVMVFSVVVRTLVFHPIHTVHYSITDIYNYIKHLKFNEMDYGYIKAYVGLFGKGKTLSAVHDVVRQYKRYNNKKVWCKRRKKFVTQKVHIISNVDLTGIPYEKFVSLSQIVKVAQEVTAKDDENGTLTVTIALADELSVQMNSRNFKTNIDALFLNTILTCRHYHLGFVYTAQRFGHVDALLRQVTSVVISCNKLWRVQCLSYYDAWEMENASSPTMLTPLRRTGFFITNKDFNAYDTFACVGNLAKSCADGDMLSEQEILALQCNNGANMDNVMSPSRKYRKTRKKMK